MRLRSVGIAPGTVIGAYRIERELGRGGFGVVYVAVDTRLERRAAVKRLLPELSHHREIVERFFNEAKAAASINHPGIVEIYDVGWCADGAAYFAMKLLDGESLGDRLARRMLPVPVAVAIARQVASALAAAHARGIVHRDLKPDNIMMVADEELAIGERAILLDFGIAKLFGGSQLGHRTRTGLALGTPTYMSPEQCRGSGDVDHRTDIYALGCILFEILAGRPPFVGEGPGEVLGMHQFVPPPPLATLRPDLPADLSALVMRALAKVPAQRIQTMAELQAALRAFFPATAETPVGWAGVASSGAATMITPVPRASPITPTTLGSSPREIASPPLRSSWGRVAWGAAALALVAASAATVFALLPARRSAAASSSSPVDAAAVDAVPVDAVPVDAAAVDATPAAVVAPADVTAPAASPSQPIARAAMLGLASHAVRRVPPQLASPVAAARGVDELLSHARSAFAEGDLATCLATAQLILAQDPSHRDALALAALAACRLKRADVARALVPKLEAARQQQILQACLDNGIAL